MAFSERVYSFIGAEVFLIHLDILNITGYLEINAAESASDSADESVAKEVFSSCGACCK